jgi:hypothetical protein
MKRYKYQALVTMYPDSGASGKNLGPSPRRMVLRCRNTDSGDSQMFTTLISCDDNIPVAPGSPHTLATLRLTGDDVADCLASGSHFSLWLGHNVGEGIITRRLFT